MGAFNIQRMQLRSINDELQRLSDELDKQRTHPDGMCEKTVCRFRELSEKRARLMAAGIHVETKYVSPKEDSTVRQINSGDRESFLRSYEWQTIRMRALTKYGPRCQCCGATPAHGAKINVDHIKPRIRYPELALDINNLQILCADCNQGKANWDETDWRHQDQYVGADDLDPQDAEHMRSIMRAR